jgi:hypothetical protein
MDARSGIAPLPRRTGFRPQATTPASSLDNTRLMLSRFRCWDGDSMVASTLRQRRRQLGCGFVCGMYRSVDSRTDDGRKRGFGVVVAFGLVLVCMACSSSSHVVPSSERAAQARRDLDAARATDTTTFYLGDTFQGLPVTVFENTFTGLQDTGTGMTGSVLYGTCDTGGEGGCATPVSVQTGPLSSAHLDVLSGCQRRTDQRGVPTVLAGGGVWAFTGTTVVRIFFGRPLAELDGGEATIMAAIDALQNLDGTVAAGQALPHPSDETLTQLDRTCGTVPTR